MTTPPNPDEEPVGDEPEVPDAVSAEEALWRSIVDNYGDRPEIADPVPEPEVPELPRDEGLPPHPDDGDSDDPGSTAVATDPEAHYVPPPPPPLPIPPPDRLLAWVGLFGVPTFVLVALLTGLAVPSWLGLVLMGWFVGGFVFLVASMSPGPGEDHDDGARL